MAIICLLPAMVCAEVMRMEIPTDELSSEAEQLAIEKAFIQAIENIDAGIVVDEALLEELGDPQQYLSSYYDQQLPGDSEAWVYVVEFEQELLATKLPVGTRGEPETVDNETAPRAVVSSEKILWLAVEPWQGEPFVLSADVSSELNDALVEVLGETDAAWVLPPLASTGATGISSRIIGNDDLRTIKRVSRELGFELVFRGVLTELGPASWLARVSEAGGTGAESYGDSSTFGEALSLALSGVSAISSDPSEQASEVLAADMDLGTLMISVSGIKGYGDFSRVTNFLGGTDVVSAWSPRGSSGGVAYFEVQIKGAHDVFMERMTLSPEAILDSSTGLPATEFKSVHYSFTLK